MLLRRIIGVSEVSLETFKKIINTHIKNKTKMYAYAFWEKKKYTHTNPTHFSGVVLCIWETRIELTLYTPKKKNFLKHLLQDVA